MYATSNTNPTPIVSDYIGAGVIGVSDANLTAVNAAVDAKEKGDADTTEKVQAIVDTVFVEADKLALAIIATETIKTDRSVKLPALGANGSTITWAKTSDTSNVAVLTGATGPVTFTRSTADNIDDIVVLTATITKGVITATQTVTYTVREAKAPSTTTTITKQIATNEIATVVFDEEIDAESKSRVEYYIKDIAKTGTLTFSWTGTTLTVTNTGDITTFTSNFTVLVQDNLGNTSMPFIVKVLS